MSIVETTKTPLKMVYICTPLKGNIERNVIRANLFSRFAYEHGYLPIAPLCIFTQFLDDNNSKERLDGMRFGLKLLSQCNEVWVFGGRISDGMSKEIEFAKDKGKKIRYFTSEMEEWNGPI